MAATRIPLRSVEPPPTILPESRVIIFSPSFIEAKLPINLGIKPRTGIWRNLMLKKTYIRDGRNRLIGSVTTGFSDDSSVVRDAEGGLKGRTSDRFNTTRDAHGNLVSIDTSDPGLLFGDDDE